MSLGSMSQESAPAAGLFVFLYGVTLRSVSDASALDPAGMVLSVDPKLTSLQAPPESIEDAGLDEDDDEETISELEWVPVPIEFRLYSIDDEKELDAETGYEWLPECPGRVALLWMLAAAADAPARLRALRSAAAGLDTR